MKKIFAVFALLIGLGFIGIALWINSQKKNPDIAVLSPIPKTEDELPRYSLLAPLSSYPVTVAATGSAFVRVNRQGESGVYDGLLEAVEAEYLESSPGAKLSVQFPGYQVTVFEKTGVALTRLRKEDTMLTLSAGKIGIEGSGSGRLSVQAGDLLIEASRDEPVDFSLSKEDEIVLLIREGTVKVAYVDEDNETQVYSLNEDERGVFNNGKLKIY